MTRITDKIDEINKYLDELYSIFPDDFNDYRDNLEKKAACERYYEKILEAVVDLAFLIIKFKRLKMPDDESHAFIVLLKADIIDEKLCNKLQEAKGMRNFLVHQYDKTDDLLVFEVIHDELRKDVEMFISKIF
ncbi:MAG: DUF86 domain-containing protein [archaeon]|nr:DUF86 domain-containing protein [archaeon]